MDGSVSTRAGGTVLVRHFEYLRAGVPPVPPSSPERVPVRVRHFAPTTAFAKSLFVRGMTPPVYGLAYFAVRPSPDRPPVLSYRDLLMVLLSPRFRLLMVLGDLRPSLWTVLITGVCLWFLLRHSRRRGREAKQVLAWGLFVGCMGPAGLLTYLALGHTPVSACPHCGADVPLDAPSCPGCGGALVEDPPAADRCILSTG